MVNNSDHTKPKVLSSSIMRTAAVIGIAINYSIYTVLQNVKSGDCKCVDDWRFKFCSYYSLTLIGINTLVLIVGSYQLLQKLMPVLHLLGLINIISLITYLHKLSGNDCDCEHSSLQKTMRYVGYGIIGFYIFGFVLGVIIWYAIKKSA